MPKMRAGAGVNLPPFQVVVKRNALLLAETSFVVEVKSQNAAHAAACGLSLSGWKAADLIEVKALKPAPGRSPFQHFHGCTAGVYGFCYTSRSAPQEVKGGDRYGVSSSRV